MAERVMSGRKGGDLIGYARVSTAEQEPALQVDALAAAGCARVFADRASGAIAERPELARALDHYAQATRSWYGSSTGSGARCAT